MAETGGLKERVKEAIENEDGGEAEEILSEEDLRKISRSDLDKLAQVAIDQVPIADFYLRVVGALSPAMQKKFSEDLVEDTDIEDLLVILKDKASEYHRNTIVNAAIEKVGEDIGRLYRGTYQLVSAAMQQKLNVAVGLNEDISVENLAEVLAEADQDSRDVIVASLENRMDSDDIAELLKQGKSIPAPVLLRLVYSMQVKFEHE